MHSSIFTTAKLSFFALVLFVLTQSCKKSSDLQAPAAETTTTTTSSSANTIESLRQSVASSVEMPLEKVTYSAATKNFVIDGDGLVSLQDAQARFATNGTASAANGVAQRKIPYTIASSKTNVRIYTDATVPADWVAVIDQAITNWNAAGSAITMTRVTSSSEATTMVSGYYDNTTSVIASAQYPDSYGNAGNSITINTYYSSLTDAKKVFALTHELGHTCGFSHTDGTYGTLITGTPTTDANSIMNSVCLSWTAFTNYDLLAIQTVYPAGSSTTSTTTTTTTTTTSPTTTTTTNGKGKK